MMDKKEMRSYIRAKKSSYSDEELYEKSVQAMSILEKNIHFVQAKTVLFYWSLPDEVQTHSFVEKFCTEKTILLPVVIGNDLEIRRFEKKDAMQIGAYGIDEPTTASYDGEIDLAVVPGMAFDKNGFRLGRGKGFYDRFLSSCSCFKIGICFDFQQVPFIPHNELDVRMDEVIFSPSY